MAQNVVERGDHWLHAASPPFPPPAPDRIYLFRSVKNRDVFPAASKDGFTAVRNK
jgi:hypothetical protein